MTTPTSSTTSSSTDSTASVAEQRVARGYAWLIANRPGQIGDIDPDTLDVSCLHNCVLGQTGGWVPVREQMFPNALSDRAEFDTWHHFTVEHGFHDDVTVGPDELAAQWLTVLDAHFTSTDSTDSTSSREDITDAR